MTESTTQQSICTYLSMISNNYNFIFFSVPNEGIMAVLKSFHIDKVTCFKIIAHFKKMGLLPGVSDIIIIWHRMAYCMEVKTDTGKQSKDQILFERRVIEVGGKYIIVRSIEDVKKVLIRWGIV